MVSHEYKGYVIRKRSGLTRTRAAATGYSVCFTTGRLCFSTLKEAKLYIDAKVGA